MIYKIHEIETNTTYDDIYYTVADALEQIKKYEADDKDPADPRSTNVTYQIIAKGQYGYDVIHVIYAVRGKNIDMVVACRTEEEANALVDKWLADDAEDFGYSDYHEYSVLPGSYTECNAILADGKVVGLKKKQDLVNDVKGHFIGEDAHKASEWLDSVLVNGESQGNVGDYSVTRFFVNDLGIAYVDAYAVEDEDGNVEIVGYVVSK